MVKMQLTFALFEDMQHNVEYVLVLLRKLLGELQSLLLKKIVQAEDELKQLCLNAQLYRLRKLLVDAIESKHLRKV